MVKPAERRPTQDTAERSNMDKTKLKSSIWETWGSQGSPSTPLPADPQHNSTQVRSSALGAAVQL